MTATILFLALAAGLNCIPLLLRKPLPKTERAVVRMLVSATGLFLAFGALQLAGLRLKGIPTFPAICLAFLLSGGLYFSLARNTWRKLAATGMLLPLLVLAVLALLLGRVLKQHDLDRTHKVMVLTGGFLSCGEHVALTRTRYGLFDEEIHHDGSLCLRGVHRLETRAFNNGKAEFLIHHDGTLDSENPYRLTVLNRGMW